MDDNLAANPINWREGDPANATLARRLARDNAPRGTARLGLRRRTLRRLEALLAEAGALRRGEETPEAALDRLDGQGGLALARACRAAAEGGARLPAWHGRPRIGVVAEALCAEATTLTREGLLSALGELDAIQPLTMAELWAVPEAMRAALARALLGCAGDIVARARQRARARRWARRPLGMPEARSDAFAAEALKCAGEEGLPRARRRLDRQLSRLGRTPEEAVGRAQARAAEALLRLEGLLSLGRLVDALDWEEVFRALSRVEGELHGDPSGTYARMDEPSREAVRRQVTHIARRLGIPEAAVARAAVDAARTGEGLRGEACWWLYDDEGRRALLSRLGRGGVRLRSLTPDPSGRRTVAALLGLSLALTALLTACAGRAWLWAACLPLGWTLASSLAGRFCARRFPPARLLKLSPDALPEGCRTLVTLPALLSSPKRAREVCDQLEALGCLEDGDDMAFLLLGDFGDADRPDLPGDGAVLRAARERVAAMNARAGREKYALLCRPRTLLAPDGVWMGRDRKRGALMDLNRLLLGREGAEDAFSAEGAACGRLKGRFRYVITLDADTRAVPGELRRMIGAMAHPLNRPDGRRGFAVLQPRMELPPSACANGFVRLFACLGGVSAYPVTVSSLWQDVTGRGIYGGKGIYDVAAFQARVEGALPEGRVLSHDLAEGALAGAGFLGDVALCEGHPATLKATLARQHRWIRGDWQLLPLLLSREPRLGAADRYRMLDNLVRSLRAPALLALLVGGACFGGALPAALFVAFAEPLMALGDGDGLKWRRAVAALATLPLSAWTALDAVVRTLWRLGVSGRRLMQWVTAADAEAAAGSARADRRPGRVAALLLIPGLLTPGQAPAALALAALFLVGPGWIDDMTGERIGGTEPLSDRDRATFEALARSTWRFFRDNVSPEGSPLPPDNVQLDPPVGAARRTSPTNIALYLLSCLSAARLGFIDLAEMRRRMAATLDALERMEKWRGQLYNWYDIDTLAPLRPRYVSSVDSGNLAAALLLCAGAAETAGALSVRLRALAEGMDLAALYDPRRELFFIGADGETGRPGTAHYDLLASEARLLSYTAMMLGQAPARHWRRLGRACARVSGGVAPLSWSGTMFEYLMPALFLDAPSGTLLGEGIRAAARTQADRGRRQGRPWGVSESGYGALDAALCYQYRAFGLPELALDGEAEPGVVAPYAAALAAMVLPRQAAENLRRMSDLGWVGDWGLYEAADYLRCDGEGRPALVRSHMAHHQGMTLCALCNVLTGGSLRADFMALPEAWALSPLLEEPACDAPGRRLPRGNRRDPGSGRGRWLRRCDPDAPFPETQLLSGGGATALCTDDGAVHYRREGVMATRFSGVLQGRADAARVYLCDVDAGRQGAIGGEAAFEPGLAVYSARLGRLEARMSVCLSQEDGTLLRVVELRNAGERPVRCAVADVVPVALAEEADWQAHGVFQNLFVESRPMEGDGLLLRRRPGSRGADGPRLAHLAVGPGDISREGDYEKLAGRLGDPGRAARFDRPLSGTLGCTLNPASALRLETTLAPGRSVRLAFALALLPAGESASRWRRRWLEVGRPGRALRLAAARSGGMADFIGLAPWQYHLLRRLAALLADGGLAAQARGPRRGEGGVSREALWPLGISGDRPILVMTVTRPEDAPRARALIQAHGFYRALGVEADLALVDDGERGYARPVRDGLEALVSASHLDRLRGAAGGVWLLDGGALAPAQRRALRRFASVCVTSEEDFYDQLRGLLSAGRSRREAYSAMDAGEDAAPRAERLRDNGFGGFTRDGGYEIDVGPERLPPAPWCNILANEAGGALLSERGGGFFWRGNSRENRLTPYGNDSLREGWGLMLYLVDDARGEFLRLLPGDRPQAAFRVRHDARGSAWMLDARRLRARVRLAMGPDEPEVWIDVDIENRALRGGRLRLVAWVDWLMGASPRDSVALNAWGEGGAALASGAMEGVGWLASADPLAQPGPGRRAFLGRGDGMNPGGFAAAEGEGWTLSVPLSIPRGGRARQRLALGWAPDAKAALARARALRGEAGTPIPPERPGLVIETPDGALNALVNGFLRHQVLASRVLGRTGLCQPGGAWGFRDQLQDMLALLHDDPGRVRAHLLRCAGRQFEAGDVLHWWHEPCRGVRTRVSDDRLFLPWVAAAYVEATGDVGVLEEAACYLEDAVIPEGRRDLYGQMRPGTASESLHGHCMRAFRSARRGRHGLLLMGAGDWNDGMDRVGALGRGESVWLSQFAIACADAYRRVAPSAEDRAWLWRLAEELRSAVEAHGWDGGWYLRAYTDDGVPLGSAGSAECRIDAISQAWAVLAGLDGARCRMAMDAAWERLVDRRSGLIRLLEPPFEGRGVDPGYIRGYLAGVRENGGQYTHGALWLLLALVRMGDARRAHEALELLLPFNHADTPERARVYRVEPYVMAADVYDRPGMRGRGGWTWYTGAAGWMFNCVLALLGYERRGDRVRMGALLGDWPFAAVTVPFGGSRYRLLCDKKAARVSLDGHEVDGEWIRLVDDGRDHEARFPERRPGGAKSP